MLTCALRYPGSVYKQYGQMTTQLDASPSVLRASNIFMTFRDAQQAFIATAVQGTKTFTARLSRSSVGLDDTALFNTVL